MNTLSTTVNPIILQQLQNLYGNDFNTLDTIPITSHTNDIPSGIWKLSLQDTRKLISRIYYTSGQLREIKQHFLSLPESIKDIIYTSNPASKSIIEGNFTFIDWYLLYKMKFPSVGYKQNKVVYYQNQKVSLRALLNKIVNVANTYAFKHNDFDNNIFGCPVEQLQLHAHWTAEKFQQFTNLLDNIEFDESLFNKNLYLQITDDPNDILSMSISPFYDSCTNIFTGGFKTTTLSNVFDKNMKLAFLYFNEPYELNGLIRKKVYNRTIIRKVIGGEIYIDKIYPSSCKKIRGQIADIINKYTKINVKVEFTSKVTQKYPYTPIYYANIPPKALSICLPPYMDTFHAKYKFTKKSLSGLSLMEKIRFITNITELQTTNRIAYDYLMDCFLKNQKETNNHLYELISNNVDVEKTLVGLLQTSFKFIDEIIQFAIESPRLFWYEMKMLHYLWENNSLHKWLNLIVKNIGMAGAALRYYKNNKYPDGSTIFQYSDDFLYDLLKQHTMSQSNIPLLLLNIDYQVSDEFIKKLCDRITEEIDVMNNGNTASIKNNMLFNMVHNMENILFDYKYSVNENFIKLYTEIFKRSPGAYFINVTIPYGFSYINTTISSVAEHIIMRVTNESCIKDAVHSLYRMALKNKKLYKLYTTNLNQGYEEVLHQIDLRK